MSAHVQVCQCGTPFQPANSRQRWCEPNCPARKDHLRDVCQDWYRKFKNNAEADAIPNCLRCERPRDRDAMRDADLICTICRRCENYAATKTRRIAEQLDAESAREPVRSLGVVTIGREQFDLVWSGRGSLPGASWAPDAG